ncbi:hypothetical protein H1220_04760 [Carnobacteriaceae bacterium zg-84]|uniref:type VII secretion protein EssB/YukC n=1 Tax=Granulicatella sp. zg-84 TaxID=2678503 RepID=UPI0013C06CF7|nr:type VII secretion protein EssB/YukC [Granulicatella sp. zg-84]NEW66784.1 hypothetical protein [Granulicatella sp. zg-84]QMI85060.1 hypothetical protein H1220_04760 [Carnobacteriaceae bacterium zg-84]
MIRMTGNSQSLLCQEFGDKLIVSLNKSQYTCEHLSIIKLYYTIVIKEEMLICEYDIKDRGFSLESYRNNKLSYLEKICIAKNIVTYIKQMDMYTVPYIHPKNIYIADDITIHICHVGMPHLVYPYKDYPMMQYVKAILLWLLHPKYSFEQLQYGQFTLSDTFSNHLHQIESIEQLDTYLQAEYQKEIKKQRKQKKYVSKYLYVFYKVGFLVMSVIFGMNIITKPIYDTIEYQLQTAFLKGDYDFIQEQLKGESLDNLSQIKRYLLAYASIQRQDSKYIQKIDALKTISLSSSSHVLNFWIYLGKKDYQQALEVAKINQDKQMLLLAYLHLYDTTKKTVELSDTQEQLLTEYKKEIDYLYHELDKKEGKNE